VIKFLKPEAISTFVLLLTLTVCLIIIFSSQIYLRLRQVARDKAEVELKLRASELRYRVFFESAPNIGVAWTKGYVVTDWNKQAEQVFGWTRAEVLGRSCLDFLIPESGLAKLAAALLEINQISLPSYLINTAQTRNGRILTIEWSNVWLPDVQQQKLEVMSLGLDITERIKTDAILASALKNVERAEDEQRELLLVASHEFRTPAAMIKASLDSLNFLKDSITPEVALRLENIRQASLRLIGLANHLISEDRLHEMSMQPHMALIDICELARDVVSRYAVASNLQLQLPAFPVMLAGDLALLTIALHNLIDNALQNNLQKGLPIVVSVIMSDGIVEIQVADLGPGVPEKDQENVFQRFHSAKGGTSHGLGLSIVNSVARTHGGITFVFDNIPHGAVFVIQLPGNYQSVRL
jgi:PAS domain S-box-containing protein